MPKDVFDDLRHAWVAGKKLDISRLGGKPVNKRATKPEKPTSAKKSKSKHKRK